ncbi:hypothetical protein E2P81_ATG07736 [Venturia nashicola]|nr:hypothetical protein E2P81_ATG07736 [Venturia nashicola]
MLRQQSLILKNVIEPPLPEPQLSSREARVSVVESAKDRWNSEIERLVKKAQTTDWNQVGGRAADGFASLWSKAAEKAKDDKPWVETTVIHNSNFTTFVQMMRAIRYRASFQTGLQGAFAALFWFDSSSTFRHNLIASICDILSVIKRLANTLSPKNAHYILKTTYQGLDDAASKLATFQEGLKRTCSAAIYDSDTPGAFFTVFDTLLDVVREIEVAPEKIAYEGKTKRPLKETWRNLKSFGPIIGERQWQLRKLYISTLNVVVKVLSLSHTLPHVLEKAGLIDNDWIFQVKRCVLTQGFTQSFGTDPLKSNAACEIGVPIPLLIACSSHSPSHVYRGHSRRAEIMKRSSALDKAHAEASRWGRINGRGWRNDEAIPNQSVPTLTEFEHMVQAIREVTVGIQEVESGDEEDEAVTDHFRPVDYKQEPALSSNISSRVEHHDPACSHQQEEYEDCFSMNHEVVRPRQAPKPVHAQTEPLGKVTAPLVPVPAVRAESDPTRCDSAVDSVLAPDLTDAHFDIHGLKRYTNAELNEESGENANTELIEEPGENTELEKKKKKEKSKKDSGAIFEIEGEVSRCSEEAKPLEMPIPQSLDVPDLQMMTRKVVEGYFDL